MLGLTNEFCFLENFNISRTCFVLQHIEAEAIRQLLVSAESRLKLRKATS